MHHKILNSMLERRQKRRYQGQGSTTLNQMMLCHPARSATSKVLLHVHRSCSSCHFSIQNSMFHTIPYAFEKNTSFHMLTLLQYMLLSSEPPRKQCFVSKVRYKGETWLITKAGATSSCTLALSIAKQLNMSETVRGGRTSV